MCTHQKVIRNKYTGDSVLVPCGKCKSCLQAKAYKRAFRIKMEQSPDFVHLFVTLTYDRSSCPFIKLDELRDRPDVLNVYREFTTRRVRVRTKKYGLIYADRRKYEEVVLSQLYFPDYDSLDEDSKMHHLAFRTNNVGVCFYPDLQLFKKRFFMNLKRKYNFDYVPKIFSASEYGSTSGRPHFHLSMCIRPSDEEVVRTAICESWPFASKYRTAGYIELARDCANYIATYINCDQDVSKFLSTNFKTKHSYTKDFGMGDKLFSLDSILSCIKRCNMSYLRRVGDAGKGVYFDMLYPKYVVNRYFPLFKGYSRFNDIEILDILSCFAGYRRNAHTPLVNLDKLLSINYTKDDIFRIGTSLSNAYEKYCRVLGVARSESSLMDYCISHRDAWKVRKMTAFRLWHEGDEPLKYKYDNIADFLCGLIDPSDLTDAYLDDDHPIISNPNVFPKVRELSTLYESIYDFRVKEKKVNNFVMANNNYYF